MRKVVAALTVIGALASPAVASAANQRLYPATLPADVAHPGSAIIAFSTPVQAAGARFAPSPAGGAGAADVAALNSTLSSLGATSVEHLFTNVPAAQLAAARAQAQAATGRFVTDFTQVYQVAYDPKVNAGEAADELAKSKLLSAAMPDWIYRKPKDPARLSRAQAKRARAALSRAKASQKPDAAALPRNSAYRTDAQSYQDAAGNDVTGAATMIGKRFGQQPGQGEYVTNISLGNVTDKSTELRNGQRYIVQAGYPRIPVWLSTADCTPTDTGQSCAVALDPSGTTQDDQGDFVEVDLDFSVMAPPPLGDPRIANPAPAGNGELIGEAYGASYRLINPKVNDTENFVGAFLGAGFLQTPKANTITASIGSGFAIGGFSDYYFEDEAIIHDVVSTLVQGADTFVSISAGDGQTETSVAMNPNGITGPTGLTRDPSQPVDIDDPDAWADPDFSYGLTVEPQFVLDSGADDAAADTLNDVFNNSPFNTRIDPSVSHSQHTTETRWTGQQNFHTGFGSRATVSAPGDNILILAQIEDANGDPVSPAASFPRLIGGSSASAPEVAGAAAVVRQAARLLGQQLSATQIRALLEQTGRQAAVPAFDLDRAHIGPSLDLTRAVQALFDRAHANGTPSFTRMTVAQRKAALTPTDLRSAFYTDTPQDPVTGTATIDLSQGLVAPSSRTNETIGATGDNLNAPITFAADAAFMSSLNMRWTLALGRNSVTVPGKLYDAGAPALRLLPSEIFDLLGAPVTARRDRVVTVTASSGKASISMDVTFKGQADATYSHAVPPSFDPVFQSGDKIKFTYDLTGLRGADGGELIVSDIDRAVPQAFPDNNLDAHGRKYALPSFPTGTIKLDASDFPHGVGTYGIALRGTRHGAEIADSTSFWQPLRFAPARQQLPATPKIQAAASALNGSAPLFYDVADVEPGGSTQFGVTYDVRGVTGARGALVEFSRPTYDFAKALFIDGRFTASNSFVNNFTNPNGDRLDTGNDYGQAGETTHAAVAGTHGFAVLDGAAIGLSIPPGNCDSTYQVRVFATDAAGHILGVASNGSILSYYDFSRAGCTP
ncbi:S8 family serine peptidase [Candidatus Solirubrobacter pratensis]|uniref:S8 family serine peptidase n=1 Tax=Candidatus Solirubrobacter pratensis TaxID=1298857 RepID=UPI0004198CD8|nr:S8 family serine peptidase [Candidatus Solirubrobacter pratensis]